MVVHRMDEVPDIPDDLRPLYGKGHYIEISKSEALSIISSLALQIKDGDLARLELRDKNNAVFSIRVIQD